jgi:hypothetical protein
MMRISVFVACLLVLALTGSVALALPPDGKGVPGGTETPGVPSTGKPINPNAWGAVTSQFATTDGATFGQHASDPPFPEEEEGDDSAGGRGTHDTPRLGVGNVARTDGGTGGRPSDHACVVGPFFGSDCSGDPGPLP